MEMEYIIILMEVNIQDNLKIINKNGYGILYHVNGDKYEGQYKDDKFDGNITLYKSNGLKIKGIFKK